MQRPKKLDPAAVDAWLASHAGWTIEEGALCRQFRFADYGRTIAFVVRLGMEAERRDHHPDLQVGWGRVKVVWTTHDAGGITALDLELAGKSDEIAGA